MVEMTQTPQKSVVFVDVDAGDDRPDSVAARMQLLDSIRTDDDKMIDEFLNEDEQREAAIAVRTPSKEAWPPTVGKAARLKHSASAHHAKLTREQSQRFSGLLESKTGRSQALLDTSPRTHTRHGRIHVFVDPPHVCMLNPHHPFNAAWNIILAVFCIYVALVVPLRIGFQIELCPNDWAWWIELVVDLTFAMDVALNFRTGVIVDAGVVKMDPKFVGCQYLRGWFVIDMVSVLPFSYVGLLISDAGCGSLGQGQSAGAQTDNKGMKVIRLLKLGKMLKLAQLRHVWPHLAQEFEALQALGRKEQRQNEQRNNITQNMLTNKLFFFI